MLSPPPPATAAGVRRERLALAGAADTVQAAASGSVYGDLTAAEAVALAQEDFPQAAAAPVYDGPPLAAGDRIVKYVGDTSAIIDQAGSSRDLVLQSMAPLRAPDAAGQQMPVDLHLRDTGSGGLAPVNPLVDSTLPTRLSAGVSFPGTGISLTPPGADQTGSVVDDRVFFPDALNDTDIWAQPTISGAELFAQLRSSASPEELDFHVGMPAGATLRMAPGVPGAAEVVKDGKRLTLIPAASATDAAGTTVPVTVSVQGDTLQVRVAHQGKGFFYPILVDPSASFDWTCPGNGNCDTSGDFWWPAEGGPGCSPGPTCSNSNSLVEGQNKPNQNPQPCNAFSYGLCVNAPAAGYFAGMFGEWRYPAAWSWPDPTSGGASLARSGAYVQRLDGTAMAYTAWNTCMKLGIEDPNGNLNTGDLNYSQKCYSATPWSGYVSITPPGVAGNYAVMRLLENVTGTSSGVGSAAISQATVTMGDTNSPTTPTVSGVPSGWQNATVSPTVASSDSGLGVQQLHITGPGGFSAQDGWFCSGTPAAACPKNASKPVAVSTAAPLAEGIDTMTATATGPENSTSPGANFTLKVDRTAPSVAFSGSLYDHRTDAAISDQPLSLTVTANDGAPTDNSTRRSGVRSIEVDVDGQPIKTDTQACGTDSCPMSSTVSFDPGLYAEGKHTISVIASDQAGNTTDAQNPSKFDVTIHHGASSNIGPGSVNLLNGEFSTSSTDVSISAPNADLTLARSYTSRRTAGGSMSPFGPEWSASLPVDASSSDYASITSSPWTATLAFTDGSQENFYLSGKTGSTLTYSSPVDDPSLQLTATQPASDITAYQLTDADGNETDFTLPSGTLPAGYQTFLPSSTTQPGSTNKVSFQFTYTGGTNQLSQMLAPVPAGVSCTTLVRGCRALGFTYASSTTATGLTSSGWGDYTGRLKQVTFTAWDPASSSMTTTTVEQYSYDSNGALRAAWDPRISPALKTTYDYDGAHHLTNLTPPGLGAWTLAYTTVNGDSNTGRLATVSHATPQGSGTETMAYNVPVSGAGAPHAMGASDVSAWAQSDTPTAATAIFPADSVPASPPTGYSRAEVHYLDVRGREVNVAEPGGRISTTEYDGDDNITRTLTPANRQRALDAGSGSAAKAQLLDTQTSYRTTSTGDDPTDVLGPQHSVQLLNGTTVQARTHTVTAYNEGVSGEYHLPTTVTESARLSDGSDTNARTSTTSYDWNLRLPVVATTDPNGLALVHATAYNAAGQVISTRQPANSGGGDAHETDTIYWTAGTNGQDASCGNKPEYAGLACKTEPAAQPGTSGQPDLPVTTHSDYNALDEPTTISQSEQSQTRTTTKTYDIAGRPTQASVNSSTGTGLPSTTQGYDSQTGLPTTQSDGTRTVTTGYDSVGRVTSYTDADGVTSTTSYDLDGRPLVTDDGKGTQTRAYDPTTGDLTSLVDSALGTFTAQYNADGALTQQSYPNGMDARYTLDETGDQTALTYVKTSNCSSNCNWLNELQTSSIHGQWLHHTSDLSTQDYSYDPAGRLTQVQDRPTGQGCTTRLYAFDADSNRTSLTTRVPNGDGTCDTTAGHGSTQTYSYDAADRLTDPGANYDPFGNTTSLASNDSGGGMYTATYYVDNTLRSQTQAGQTITYNLDPAGRTRQRTTTGTNPADEINHYSDGSDAPAWTIDPNNSSNWTRNITGIDGNLAAIDNHGTQQLQLTNLHGDVVGTINNDYNATAAAWEETTEFGSPRSGTTARPYDWLGSKRRRTELASGVVQMGARSYFPSLGRFGQTDPVPGGSANAYDYVGADPLNQYDLAGTSCQDGGCGGAGVHWCRHSHSRACREWVRGLLSYTRGGYGGLHLSDVAGAATGAICGFRTLRAAHKAARRTLKRAIRHFIANEAAGPIGDAADVLCGALFAAFVIRAAQ